MRRRSRGASQAFQLVSAMNLLGACRVIRRIGFAEGEAMVASRKAERVEEGGNLVGYQLTQDVAYGRRADELVISSSGITRTEFAAFMGELGGSRTLGMTARRRDARVMRGLPAEDFVERASMKVATYAATH